MQNYVSFATYAFLIYANIWDRVTKTQWVFDSLPGRQDLCCSTNKIDKLKKCENFCSIGEHRIKELKNVDQSKQVSKRNLTSNEKKSDSNC